MRRKRKFAIAICIVYVMALLLGVTACGGEDRNLADDNPASSISTDGGGVGEDIKEISDDTYSGPYFADEKERSYINVAYKAPVYSKNVKPYAVKSDLSNVENLSQYGVFSSEQIKLLSQNGFVVTPSKEEQLFYIYETNEYLKLPSFVTADSVLQVYHIFFDYSLRTLEAEKLLDTVEELTENMLDKSVYLYNEVENPKIKELALKNAAYFAVAQLALEKELPGILPPKAKEIAEEEYTKVFKAAGFDKSSIVDFKLDYSQYKPRGHYTRNHEFERYFRTMMWYGQVPFSIYSTKDDGTIELNPEGTARALMVTYSLFLSGRGNCDAELWENIYDPTVFYVGSSDDLTIYECKEILVKVFGEKPNVETFLDENNIEKLRVEADKLREPEIMAKWTTENTNVQKQFRFMGQRYIPDSEILQKLVEPIKRPMPTGMDVMGVLGSDRAYEHAVEFYKAEKLWEEYPKLFGEMREKFSKLPQEKWQSNMYYGWLWVLKSLISPVGEGYPSFMANRAWEDKSLNTALGSWSELRHDTILYAKQSGAECGGGSEPPVLKGYVEPNIELYSKLLWLTQYSRENLTSREILPQDMKNRMMSFESLLQFLITCSEKELRNEELSREEYDTLLTYGGTLEYLTSSFAGNGTRWFEITSDTDKNMAVIADVHTVAPGTYLEVGVGPASQIFVVVPIGGKLYLTRGAVFSYYEFETDKRLTDEEWQKMHRENTQPSRPEWTDTFEAGEKDEIPVPVEPYSSGC